MQNVDAPMYIYYVASSPSIIQSVRLMKLEAYLAKKERLNFLGMGTVKVEEIKPTFPLKEGKS
jgi:hypothetical protein